MDDVIFIHVTFALFAELPVEGRVYIGYFAVTVSMFANVIGCVCMCVTSWQQNVCEVARGGQIFGTIDKRPVNV